MVGLGSNTDNMVEQDNGNNIQTGMVMARQSDNASEVALEDPLVPSAKP